KGLGDVIDNEQMEAEGEAERLKGQARQDAAKTSERARGAGEELKGNLKKGVGDVIDNEQMEAEGEAERLKGQARQKANQ
ncbi:MAG: CsbD family protein, partial [Roseiflexaceae bacterium]